MKCLKITTTGRTAQLNNAAKWPFSFLACPYLAVLSVCIGILLVTVPAQKALAKNKQSSPETLANGTKQGILQQEGDKKPAAASSYPRDRSSVNNQDSSALGSQDSSDPSLADFDSRENVDMRHHRFDEMGDSAIEWARELKVEGTDLSENDVGEFLEKHMAHLFAHVNQAAPEQVAPNRSEAEQSALGQTTRKAKTQKSSPRAALLSVKMLSLTFKEGISLDHRDSYRKTEIALSLHALERLLWGPAPYSSNENTEPSSSKRIFKSALESLAPASQKQLLDLLHLGRTHSFVED